MLTSSLNTAYCLLKTALQLLNCFLPITQENPLRTRTIVFARKSKRIQILRQLKKLFVSALIYQQNQIAHFSVFIFTLRPYFIPLHFAIFAWYFLKTAYLIASQNQEIVSAYHVFIGKFKYPFLKKTNTRGQNFKF